MLDLLLFLVEKNWISDIVYVKFSSISKMLAVPLLKELGLYLSVLVENSGTSFLCAKRLLVSLCFIIRLVLFLLTGVHSCSMASFC